MLERLFVYGTLAPGEPNAHELADVDGTWERATVRGRLYDSAWGAAMGYPGIVIDQSGGEVPGHVLTSPKLADHWQRLDAFEGDGYNRVLATATLASGATVDAYVYELSDQRTPANR